MHSEEYEEKTMKAYILLMVIPLGGYRHRRHMMKEFYNINKLAKMTVTTTVWYSDFKDFKGLSYFINVMVGCGIFKVFEIAANFMRIQHSGDWYLYDPETLEMWAKRQNNNLVGGI